MNRIVKFLLIYLVIYFGGIYVSSTYFGNGVHFVFQMINFGFIMFCCFLLLITKNINDKNPNSFNRLLQRLFLFFNPIVKTFEEGTNGKYRMSDYKVHNYLKNYEFDFDNPVFSKKINFRGFKAEKVKITLPNKTVLEIPEANISIQRLTERWREVGRTLIGEEPNRAFYSLEIDYQTMDIANMIFHIDYLQKIIGFDDHHLQTFLKEINTFENPKSMDINEKVGSKFSLRFSVSQAANTYLWGKGYTINMPINKYPY